MSLVQEPGVAPGGRWTELFTDLGGRSLEDVGVLPFAALLGLSLASAFFVSYLYVTFYASRATGSQIHRAFPLLAISITAIFICIQFSLPLSLGLLGALSIVRFRTPIKEPEEIGFLMLVIATSLCCATFNLLFLGLLLGVALVALLARQATGGGRRGTEEGLLTLELPRGAWRAHGVRLVDHLAQRLPRGHVDGVTEEDERATLSFRFRRLDARTLGALQEELEHIAPGASTSVFYLRSGGV